MSERIVKSTCRLCYHSCGILIHIENDRPVKISGDPHHPVSRGVLCKKGRVALDYLDNPHRLKQPLRRTGDRGQGNWQPIGWDEALDAVASNLLQAKSKYGVESIQVIKGGCKGIADLFLSRFANTLGTPNYASMASICFVPGEKASQFTYGYYAVPDFDYPPQCIVVWGCDPARSCISVYTDISQAVKNGSKLIVIDPLKSKLAQKADLWLQIRPGTDLALALSFINVIINEKLFDAAFVREWTVGFDRLKSHVQDYGVDKTAELTWTQAAQIVQAARMFASGRPGVIHWGNGLDTNLNSFQTCRAIAMLRAITGNLAIPGGELKWDGIATHNVYPIPFMAPESETTAPGATDKHIPASPAEVTCHSKVPTERRRRALSRADHLAPFISYVLPQRVIKSILYEDPYPVRSVFIQGANILTSYPNSNETYQALSRLEFLVVSDMFMTPTAMMADIVLPAASHLEFDSIEAPCHIPIASVQQKVATVGQSWSDMKIINELAKKLALPGFWKNSRQMLDWIMEPAGITFDEFRKIGCLAGTKHYRHFARHGFDTPSGKVELFSEQLEKAGVDPLPAFRELPETPLSDPGLAGKFPLVAVNRKSAFFKHSRDRQIPALRKMHPEPLVRIHPQTAASLGIAPGDRVTIENRRGKIRQKAELSNEIDPRIVEIDYGWYFPECQEQPLFNWAESNMNVLTNNSPPFNREMGSSNLRGFCCRIYKS